MSLLGGESIGFVVMVFLAPLLVGVVMAPDDVADFTLLPSSRQSRIAPYPVGVNLYLGHQRRSQHRIPAECCWVVLPPAIRRCAES